MKLYRDTENGTIISETDLYFSFCLLQAEHETDAKTFSEYLINCTDKNGFLEEVKE